jgi:hypothetical protein
VQGPRRRLHLPPGPLPRRALPLHRRPPRGRRRPAVGGAPAPRRRRQVRRAVPPAGLRDAAGGARRALERAAGAGIRRDEWKRRAQGTRHGHRGGARPTAGVLPPSTTTSPSGMPASASRSRGRCWCWLTRRTRQQLASTVVHDRCTVHSSYIDRSLYCFVRETRVSPVPDLG